MTKNIDESNSKEKERKEIMFKEIDLLQSNITRMSSKTSEIKTWTIGLMTVILTLLPEKVDHRLLFLVCIVSSLFFCFFASYYLYLERCFRLKYQWVICNRMKTDDYPFDLNPKNKNTWDFTGDLSKKPTIINSMFSISICPIYIILIFFELLYFCFANEGGQNCGL